VVGTTQLLSRFNQKGSSSSIVESRGYSQFLLICQQVRAKLSTFGGYGGPTEVTCGGNALKFYASVRLNTRQVGFVKKGDEVR
jgi:RecA/RadA recombinase